MKQICFAFALAVAVLASSLAALAQGPAGTSGYVPIRIVGHAISIGGVGNPTGSARVEIQVTGQTSMAARQRMLEALKTGQQALLTELRDAPSVGSIRFGTELAWALRYAQRQPREDGGVRLVLATDRPMSGWEIINFHRYTQYPFTLITIDLDANGEGEGQLVLAARITSDPSGEFVHVENYASQPIQLHELKATPLQRN